MSETNALFSAGKKLLGQNNRKRTVISVAAVSVVVLFLGRTMLLSDDDAAETLTASVKRGAVTIKITEIGELRAADQITIGASTDKQILWLAPEGSWVEEGDTLIIYESEKYIISRGEAESAVLMVKADLIKAQSDLEAQQAKEEATRKNLESLPELVQKGYIQPNEMEQARLSYMELKSRTRAFQASVEAARANVERGERAVTQQERKLRQGVVLAPREGLVVYAVTGNDENARKIEVGMVPFEGMDLMYLPDISSMLVDSEISEVDLSRVRVGLPVEIHLDAYPDAVFGGEVSSIADLAKRKISRITGKATGAKVFDVTVKVTDNDKRLKPGLTATSDIIVNHYEDVLYVPLESVFVDEHDRTIAYVRYKNGKIEVRPVVLGESNDRLVVVKEGLKENEEVLLGRPQTT